MKLIRNANEVEKIVKSRCDRLMTQNSKKWKKLYEDEYEVYWQTPKRRNGKCMYVISSRGVDIYYTKEEFENHIYAIGRVNDELYKPNGRCYL